MTLALFSFNFWRDRLRASTIHLGISLSIAALAALLVFGIWYPYPYREISGGRELFFIVVSVDVILGPLITLAVFNRKKPWTELRLDLTVVGLIQLSALVYGIWTVAVARPVHLVFEIDRFRVVHAIDVDPALLKDTPQGIVALPWTGPTLLAVRPFKDSKESFDATMAAIQGASLGARPDLWQPYAAGIPNVLLAAKPVSNLRVRFPKQVAQIDQVLQKLGKTPGSVVYLPLAGRKDFWTVLLDATTAEVLGALPLDSF